MKILLDPAVFVTLVFLLFSLRVNSLKIRIAALLMVFFTFLPISESLVFSLEAKYPVPTEIPRVGAVVVFGGGFLGFNQKTNQYEYSGAFDRLGEALRLVRAHQIKYLVFTGVTPDLNPNFLSEANSVERFANQWGIRPEQIRIDDKAVNTFENGMFSKKILEDLGVNDFLLITSASHMARAVGVLRHIGLNPQAYPVDHQVSERDLGKLKQFGLGKWLLLKIYLHEVVGYFYYKMRGYV